MVVAEGTTKTVPRRVGVAKCAFVRVFVHVHMSEPVASVHVGVVCAGCVQSFVCSCCGLRVRLCVRLVCASVRMVVGFVLCVCVACCVSVCGLVEKRPHW